MRYEPARRGAPPGGQLGAALRAASRSTPAAALRYARLHYRRPAAALEAAGIALCALTHAAVAAPRRRAEARGWLAALRVIPGAR